MAALVTIARQEGHSVRGRAPHHCGLEAPPVTKTVARPVHGSVATAALADMVEKPVYLTLQQAMLALR